MKYHKAIVLAAVFACNISYARFFPLCGYGCEQISQADSCSLNTVLFWWQGTKYVDSLFEAAENAGMKIILGAARRPNFTDITSISGGQRTVYQAESKAYAHGLGKKVFDIDAHSDTAYLAYSSIRGWLQVNNWVNERYRYSVENLQCYAHFRLKTNNTTGNYPVCSLFVRRKENGNIHSIAQRSITPRDFTRAGVYDTFTVAFELKKDEINHMDYAVLYTGTKDSIYSDEVEVLDITARNLRNGTYNEDIAAIAAYYGKKPAMFRYYLWDEPRAHQLWASGRVNSLLKQVNNEISGIQTVDRASFFQTYLDVVGSNELLIDFYPFNGTANYFERTPIDSGRVFQERIDALCDFLGEARVAAKVRNKVFWYIPQAFGQAITDESYSWHPVWNEKIPVAHEGWWREPSRREMRCMVWLSLAYGAQGIIYYRYQSRPEHYYYPHYDNYEDYHWIVGLTDSSGSITRPLWHSVKEINEEIESLSHILLQLKSDSVFESTSIPKTGFIRKVSDRYLQIGTFHSQSDSYFIVVNRRCLPDDSITVEIEIEFPEKINLRDCAANVKIPAQQKCRHIYEFSIRLLPGQGKLYKLEPES